MQLSDRIGRRIRLNDLNTLMAVVQSGSMSKAAALLNTTQPAVSRAIAEIEHTLGVPLLDRSSQGVEPTRYGHALMTRVVAVFDELRQGVQDMEFLSDVGAGELKIQASPGMWIVVSIIERLSQRYPRVVFHVEPRLALADRDLLRERRVELAVTRIDEVDGDEEFESEFLFDDSFVIVAAAMSPWARKRRIELSELVKERWALPTPSFYFHDDISRAFHSSGSDVPRGTVYSSVINLRVDLAATGRFIAVIPKYALSDPKANPLIKVLPVELPGARRRIGIVTLKNRTLSPLAKVFIDCAREIAKPLGEKGRKPAKR